MNTKTHGARMGWMWALLLTFPIIGTQAQTSCPWQIVASVDGLQLTAKLSDPSGSPQPAAIEWTLNNAQIIGSGPQLQYTLNGSGLYYLCAQYTWQGIACSACTTLVVGSGCVDSTLINPDAVCPAIYDPVCGCNGVTYGNSCEAVNFGGVTAWTPGPCASSGCNNYCFFELDYTRQGAQVYAWLSPRWVNPPLPDSVFWIVDGVPANGFGAYLLHLFPTQGLHEICARYAGGENQDCQVCQVVEITTPCIDSSLIENVPCPLFFDPVCGCDGVTYGNACEAEKWHGVTTWRPGACGSPCNDLFADFSGFNSGGSFTFWTFDARVFFPKNADLNITWNFGNGQTAFGPSVSTNFLQAGDYFVCMDVQAVLPDGSSCHKAVCDTVRVGLNGCIDPALIDSTHACIEIYDPVCGCDGVTYANDCHAQYYGGVTSWTPGVCPDQCVQLAWIDPNVGCPDVWDPVCGCNGITYGNSCDALYAGGVSSWTKGVCCNPACQAFFIATILPNRTVMLSDFSYTAESWSLDFGDGQLHGGYFDSLLHTYSAPGIYTICLDISNFAGNCSDKYCVTVDFSSSTTNGPGAQGPAVLLAPNPAADRVRVQVDDTTPVRRAALFDLHGRLLWQQNDLAPNFEIDVHALAASLYLLHVETERGVASVKVAVE